MKALPQALIDKLDGVKGFEKEAFLSAHEQSAVTSIRLNPKKPSESFANEESVPWCSDGRYLSERPVFTLDPLFHAGAYYVQEASSMFLHHVLQSVIKDRTGLRVLDLCGAPGGKSTLIASLLDDDSLLICNEVIRSRASILEENITKWGYANTWVSCNDPKSFSKLKGYFDIIVVDAPCSGSGLFRKDAAAIDEWSEDNVVLCYERQQRILADIWPALKQDGVLVYATCSYSEEEDESNLDWLAENYSVESFPVAIDEHWGVVETASTKHNMAGYRFYPDKVRGEGFFIGAIIKKDEVATVKLGKQRSVHNDKVFQQAKVLLNNKDWACLEANKNEFCVVFKEHEHDWQMLKQFLYMRKVGIAIGMPTAKEWVPAHELALSIDKANCIPCVNVDERDALLFLKKEQMSVAPPSKGWYIISYNGLGLGWIKSLGNRVNNYLPKNQRIRMDIE